MQWPKFNKVICWRSIFLVAETVRMITNRGLFGALRGEASHWRKRASESVPHVALDEFDVIALEQLAVFILERDAAMMLPLAADVCAQVAELCRAD